MTQPRLVFAGTPDFALASLRGLVEADMPPVAVMTQPDRRSGRGRRLTASPVKQYAETVDLPVLQPATLKTAEAQEQLSALEPDLLVVAAYGLLLPQAVLDIPKHGCLNVHASLLPRWRGAAPIQAAILADDEESGVCLMHMEAGLDTGPVYARASVPLSPETTAGSLHDALAAKGAGLLVEHIAAILAGELPAEPQDDARATYAPKIQTADADIDWSMPSAEVQRRIRAYNPVPGARFRFGDENVKAWAGEVSVVSDEGAAAEPGQVLAATAAGIDVACGQGVLRLTELQRPGRKRINAGEFAAQLGADRPRFK